MRTAPRRILKRHDRGHPDRGDSRADGGAYDLHVVAKGCQLESMRNTARHREPTLDSFDPEAASRVGRLVGAFRFEGKLVPLVEPHGFVADHTDFDRELCEAGVIRFVRERMDSDWSMIPDDAPSSALAIKAVGHVLVEEIRPGIRVRTPFVVAMNGRPKGRSFGPMASLVEFPKVFG